MKQGQKGGFGISKERLSLEKSNLIEILKYNTIAEVANMYNTNEWMVNQVLTSQFSKRSVGYGRNRSYSASLIKELDLSVFSESTGAWANSKERKSYINYKQLNK